MTKQEEMWHEQLGEAFSEVGAFEMWDALPEMAKEGIAAAMENTRENWGMAFYNPSSDHGYVSAEVSELKEKVKRLEKESEDWQTAFTKNVMMRRNVESQDVDIHKDGSAEYRW